MKIRIKGNSLRYRLTRSEVDQLAATGRVMEKINFGTVSLQYIVNASSGNQLSASLQNNSITLQFPLQWIDKWINTDIVGFSHAMELEGTNDKLQLLVEKDFICMDKAIEDQTDNYPNPLTEKV